ncbi:MAG: hypothetical protein FWB74_10025 [Defluviitaleaceae bacterium]|nr:hypothetical protein [Defluviitaleaceae bacterium]
MIYWFMAGAVVLVGVAAFATYLDYARGKASRYVFTRMRTIALLFALILVILLLGRFVGVDS